MSKHVLKDATVYVGNSSVDLSDHVESVEFSLGQGNVAVTAMQDDYEQYLPTKIKRWSVRLGFYQDYDSSNVYAVLKAALTTDASFPMFIKPTTADVSATNPGFTGNVVFDGDFNILGGTVGDAQKTSVTLKGAGDLSYITSATA